jgi:predicted TIM-barrel fold metal-dependent hydrolase
VALMPLAPTHIYDEPKVDCHCHVFDPARFPYGADTFYRPVGQEIGTASQLAHMMDAYGIRFGLLVGPNSGYGLDNACMLDAIAHANGRLKGIAVVANDISRGALAKLRESGVIGVAFNATHHGVDYYLRAGPLLEHLAALDMCVSVQVHRDQLVALAPMLGQAGIPVMIDHCGRPTPEAGPDQPGFRALLALAGNGRTYVKLSGYSKISREGHPYADVRPYVDALIEAFTPDRCLWASDWPFLRAPVRVDCGPLLELVLQLLPDAEDRRKVLWETPRRLLGFAR